MSELIQSTSRNRLLSLMSERDFASLAPHLTRATFAKDMIVAVPGQAVDRLVFPESGIMSLIARSPEGEAAEVGLIGRDGFCPCLTLAGADQTSHEIVVQIAGAGFEIGTAVLTRKAEKSIGLRDLLLRYAHVVGMQCTYTALSNAVHQMDQRLARWLLMIHDRSESDDLPLTHEYISIMLSVRRPSVTNVIHVLTGNGLIETDRGYITIRNRAGLERYARDAYGKPEAEYRRLIGPMSPTEAIFAHDMH